ncbi:MAG: hypothetical protein NTX97_05025, partial [Bacteroidetes bacterium]|nr:hypothetical protein [Bacteroidota bacterium]
MAIQNIETIKKSDKKFETLKSGERSEIFFLSIITDINFMAMASHKNSRSLKYLKTTPTLNQYI